MRHTKLIWIVGLALCACRSNGYTDHTSRGIDAQEYDYGQTPGTRATSTSASHEHYPSTHASMDYDSDQRASTSTESSDGGKHADANARGALTADDRRFVESAGQGGLFEVESSRVALQKDISNHTHEFAQMMVEDHGKANKALCELARKKGLACPTSMDAEQRRELDALNRLNGPEFERQYRSVQIKAHDDAIALFERAATDCDDADLKSFASSTLPTLREHRKQLDRIDI